MTTEIFVCQDCLQWLVNADASALDYYYGSEEAEERLQAIQEGESTLTENGTWLATGDSERDLEFSRHRCDCCLSELHGSRHHMNLIHPTNETTKQKQA